MKYIRTKEMDKALKDGGLDIDLGQRMRKGLKSRYKAAMPHEEEQTSPQEYAEDKIAAAEEYTAGELYEDSKDVVRSIRVRRMANSELGQKASQNTVTGAADGAAPSFSVQRIFPHSIDTNLGNNTGDKAQQGHRMFIRQKQSQIFLQQSETKSLSSHYPAKSWRNKAVEKVKESVSRTVKAAVDGAKSLYVMLAAGSVIPLVVIVLICSLGLAVGSSFGVFFSGEDTGSGQTMQSAIQEINEEYGEKIRLIKSGTDYDYLEMSGSTAIWRDVLSVYAVKLNTDSVSPQEVASLNEEKISILRQIFWDMNHIETSLKVITEPVQTEIEDDNGNIVVVTEDVEKTVLYIEISHRTADEMADAYGFDDDQRRSLTQLLDSRNASLWAAVMYGIHDNNTAIIEVAKSQIGNVGGEPYWSWYGFSSRVEWCSCFVSWCANECGYIDSGVFPKHAGPPVAVNWFKQRDQWISGSAEPVPGMIIFFDWDNKGRSGDQNGYADHIGIVEKVEDSWVWTIEGNTSDSVARRRYKVGHYEILGYGVVQ